MATEANEQSITLKVNDWPAGSSMYDFVPAQIPADLLHEIAVLIRDRMRLEALNPDLIRISLKTECSKFVHPKGEKASKKAGGGA